MSNWPSAFEAAENDADSELRDVLAAEEREANAAELQWLREWYDRAKDVVRACDVFDELPDADHERHRISRQEEWKIASAWVEVAQWEYRNPKPGSDR